MRAWRLLLAVGLGLSLVAGTALAQGAPEAQDGVIGMTEAVDGAASGTGTVTGRVVLCRVLQRPIGVLRPHDGMSQTDPSGSDSASLDVEDASMGDLGLGLGLGPGGDADPNADLGLDVDVAQAPAAADGADASSKLRPVPSDAGVGGGQPGAVPAPAPSARGGELGAGLGELLDQRESGLTRLARFASPVADARVMIVGTSIATRTDAGGRFVLVGVPADQMLTLQAEAGSPRPLEARRVRVMLGAGETLDVGNVALSNCIGTLRPTPATPGSALGEP